MSDLRDAIRHNLPDGFEEVMSYGMTGYVVPLSRYPQGYHANPSVPLPFINLASQKNFISLYHLGLYADPELFAWFTSEYPKQGGRKLDMGKSRIRFKRSADVPLALIADLASRMSVDRWIALSSKTRK